jgi:hypothetical protein
MAIMPKKTNGFEAKKNYFFKKKRKKETQQPRRDPQYPGNQQEKIKKNKKINIFSHPLRPSSSRRTLLL